MTRWRYLVLALLIATPPLALMGVGSYALWHTGWLKYLWWPLSGCFALGYYLAYRWHSQKQLMPELPPRPLHWNERDQAAWQLVKTRAEQVQNIPMEKLGDPMLYMQAAQEMAAELANFYYPGNRDPIRKLTIQELLAVVELSAHDLGELSATYVPGGHLLTIGDWLRARDATTWYSNANKAYWMVAILFDPVQTGSRYLASQFGISMPWQQLQQRLVDWFYTAYLHRLGTYLIELYSGRLRVGVPRYKQLRAAGASLEMEPPAEQKQLLTITLVGQVKAGKSSLINALLGEQKALADVLPATEAVTRYQLTEPKSGHQLLLQDTVGYGHEGPKRDKLAETLAAAQNSDVILLVLHARTAAREADRQMLEQLTQYYAERPALKMPAILAVVTHIDLLSPAMEWQPPYQWRAPTRPKEQQIRQVVDSLAGMLGTSIAAVVPVCAAEGRIYGVQEELLPAILDRMPQARGVALLRMFQRDLEDAQLTQLWRQLQSSGTGIVKWFWDKSAGKEPAPPAVIVPNEPASTAAR